MWGVLAEAEEAAVRPGGVVRGGGAEDVARADGEEALAGDGEGDGVVQGGEVLEEAVEQFCRQV